ncbi:MAG: iron-sulfur cluster assembly scaffold protein [Chloroflexota bacterium]
MYTDIVIDHFTNPRNVGVIKNADGFGKVESAVCGDMMELYVMVEDGVIADIKYRTFGCAAAIASSSIATEMVKGQPLSVAAELTDEEVDAALGGLPNAKLHCSLLAVSALHTAIEDYLQKHPEARAALAQG